MSELNEIMREVFEKELEYQTDTTRIETIQEHLQQLNEHVVEIQRVKDLEETLWDE